MTDNYFKVPDDVAKGGVAAALANGERDVTINAFAWQVIDVLPNLGRSDRIHFFVMLCGGGSKADSDEIEDVKFSMDDDSVVATVTYKNGSVSHVYIAVIFKEFERGR